MSRVGSGNAEEIATTAETGRLNEDEMERLVRKGQEFADENGRGQARVADGHSLDGNAYCYNLKTRNQLEDAKKGLLAS